MQRSEQARIASDARPILRPADRRQQTTRSNQTTRLAAKEEKDHVCVPDNDAATTVTPGGNDLFPGDHGDGGGVRAQWPEPW